MGQAIALREDYSAHDLKRLARISGDADQVRRLLALAAVLEGASRGNAAKIANSDIQTLRDWVIRFNEEGPEGLKNRKRSGRKPKLPAEKRRKLAIMAEAGPDPELDGLVRYRLCDVKQLAEEHFMVELSENTVSRYLKQEGLSRISARPQHPKQAPQVIEDFKKTSQTELLKS